jgi:hypothetical protein
MMTIPDLTFFGSKRPRIWLRRCADETGKLAIKSYILNRGTQAETKALGHLQSIMALVNMQKYKRTDYR